MVAKIKIDKEKLIESYNKFGSINGVANYFNVCEATIRILFKNLNINYKKHKSHSFDKTFFDELNSKSAYWLGFIAADGTLDFSSRSGRLQIQLAKKDEDHIVLFKNDLNSSNEIKERLVKNNKRNKLWKNSINVYINVYGLEFAKKLSRFNIIKNKTKTFSICKEILDSEFLVDFCRGYFDGDGCICISNNSCLKNNEKFSPSLSFDIRGTEFFCNQFNEIIKKNCLPNHKNLIKFDSGTSRLFIRGNNNCKKIFEWLYPRDINNKNIRFLKRKYDIFKENL